eukprot:12934296-Heterocapsa_arctica.AAC.1
MLPSNALQGAGGGHADFILLEEVVESSRQLLRSSTAVGDRLGRGVGVRSHHTRRIAAREHALEQE